MSRVYLVFKAYSSYDELVGVCATSDIADMLKNKLESCYDTSISEDTYWEIEDSYWFDNPEAESLDFDVMHERNPQYTSDELKQAHNVYTNDFKRIYIREENVIEDGCQIFI